MEEHVDPEGLLPEAESHFRQIPGLQYPQALTTQYPRIANRIYRLREDRDELRRCFDELTHDQRGGRRGFPFDVLMDIHGLREHLLGDLTGFVLDDNNKWVS